MSPTRDQGVHGSGPRAYTPSQATRVLSILRHECVGRENRMTVAQLADRVDMDGRALREVVRDLELSQRVLTGFAQGYFVCCTAAEAEQSTRRLESQVGHMQERIDARRAMAAHLP